jgi:hypothetical protein
MVVVAIVVVAKNAFLVAVISTEVSPDPLKARFEDSTRRPPGLVYGTRPLASEEIARLAMVVVASVEVPVNVEVPVTARF